MPPFGGIEESSGDGETLGEDGSTLGEDGSTLREYGSTLREDFRESPPRTPPKALNLRGTWDVLILKVTLSAKYMRD